MARRAADSALCRCAKNGYVDLDIGPKCEVLSRNFWTVFSIAEVALSKSLPKLGATPCCCARGCLDVAVDVGCERAALRAEECAAPWGSYHTSDDRCPNGRGSIIAARPPSPRTDNTMPVFSICRFLNSNFGRRSFVSVSRLQASAHLAPGESSGKVGLLSEPNVVEGRECLVVVLDMLHDFCEGCSCRYR